MVKISKESNRAVTFSKRRCGVFKKASELSILCCAEVAITAFSPGKKVFSFGHPCAETVVLRFLSSDAFQVSGGLQLIEAHRSARVHDLKIQLTQMLNRLEMEKKRGEEFDKMRKACQTQQWWESPVEKMELTQLNQLKASLEIFGQNIRNQSKQLLFQSTRQMTPLLSLPNLTNPTGTATLPPLPSNMPYMFLN